jgi:hypothetical protein
MCSGLAQTTLRLGEDLLDQIPIFKSISRPTPPCMIAIRFTHGLKFQNWFANPSEVNAARIRVIAAELVRQSEGPGRGLDEDQIGRLNAHADSTRHFAPEPFSFRWNRNGDSCSYLTRVLYANGIHSGSRVQGRLSLENALVLRVWCASRGERASRPPPSF